MTLEREPQTSEKFTRSEIASAQVSAHIKDELKAAGVNDRYVQEASVFFLPEVLNLPSDASMDQILEKAKEMNIEVVIYTGGINWRGGEHIHQTELLNPNQKLKKSLWEMSGELSAELSHEITIPESKKEEEKPSALNFLVDAGKAVVITIDPKYETGKVVASSLRSDAIARRTLLREIHNSDVEAKLVNWSDGGFKDIQIEFAGYIAIADDLKYAFEQNLADRNFLDDLRNKLTLERSDPDAHAAAYSGLTNLLMKVRNRREGISTLGDFSPEHAHIKQHLKNPVFKTGYEALSYFEALRDTDDIRGGAPSIPEELALPFRSTNKNPLVRGPLRDIANQLVKYAGENEANPLVDVLLHKLMPQNSVMAQGNDLLLFRLLELGRGKMGGEDLDTNSELCILASLCIQGARGDGLDVTLGDTSGDVVNTASKENATPTLSRIVNGRKSLYIETRDDTSLPSIHVEIKRGLRQVEQVIDAQKLGLITEEADSESSARYRPSTLETSGQHKNTSMLHVTRALNKEKYRYMVENGVDPDTGQTLLATERRRLENVAELFTQ